MNKFVGIGRLTKDPDVTYTTGENAMARAIFTLALDRNLGKNADENAQKADFPRCIAFGKTAETIKGYVHKGTKIAVEGRIATGSYTNKDGVKVYTTDIIVERFEFCESKSADNGGGNTRQSGNRNNNQPDFMNVPDSIEEELPF